MRSADGVRSAGESPPMTTSNDPHDRNRGDGTSSPRADRTADLERRKSNLRSAAIACTVAGLGAFTLLASNATDTAATGPAPSGATQATGVDGGGASTSVDAPDDPTWTTDDAGDGSPYFSRSDGSTVTPSQSGADSTAPAMSGAS